MSKTFITLTIAGEEEVECTVKGVKVPYVPAGREAEAEGGYAEDIAVYRNDSGVDVTSLLTESQLEDANDALMDTRESPDDGRDWDPID